MNAHICRVFLICFAFAALPLSLTAQEQELPFRLGLLGGLNYSTVGLDSADANGGIVDYIPDAVVASDRFDGNALAPYGGLLFEYIPGMFGFHLRTTYDDRKVTFGENDEATAKLPYLSIEPALRVALGNPNFHLLAGPSLNLSLSSDLSYTPVVAPGVGDLANLKGSSFGLWGGLGYDIPITKISPNGTGWFLTPFIEAHWMNDQVENTVVDASWSSLTFRGGLALKIGFGGAKSDDDDGGPVSADGLNLTVRTPVAGVTDQRQLQEYLPLLNYLFFEKGETGIPNKYETISGDRATTFNENALAKRAIPTTGPVASATRSKRQLDVYYNLLNVIGSRMSKNPDTKITLVGASPNVSEAKGMAESVKSYLTSTFGIAESRIETKGQKKPPHASGTRSTPRADQPLINEENIRVEILTDDAVLLEPVRINVRQESSLENDVVLNLESDPPASQWNVQVEGEGYDQTYGPFFGPTSRLYATPILGDRDRGDYVAKVTTTETNGSSRTVSAPFTLKKGVPEETTTGTRYSILFEYDDPSSVKRYEAFLRKEIAPKIPNKATVFIHGHTDVTGTENYNFQLSAKRAVETEKILRDELQKLGRTVTFDSYGFGETRFRAPFGNELPEGRYYNRTVMIEIIPSS